MKAPRLAIEWDGVKWQITLEEENANQKAPVTNPLIALYKAVGLVADPKTELRLKESLLSFLKKRKLV